MADPTAADRAAQAARNLRARITDKTGTELVFLVVGEARALLAEREEWGAALAENRMLTAALANRDRILDRAWATIPEGLSAEDDSLSTHIAAALAERDAEINRLRAGMTRLAAEVLRQTHVVASTGQLKALEAIAVEMHALLTLTEETDYA